MFLCDFTAAIEATEPDFKFNYLLATTTRCGGFPLGLEIDETPSPEESGFIIPLQRVPLSVCLFVVVSFVFVYFKGHSH